MTLEWHLTNSAESEEGKGGTKEGGKEGVAPTKYELQWRLGAEGASWCSSAGSRAITVMSATKRNLQRNELYRFRVRAYWEEIGWGEFCTASSAVRCGDEEDDSVVGVQDTAAAVKAAVAQVEHARAQRG